MHNYYITIKSDMSQDEFIAECLSKTSCDIETKCIFSASYNPKTAKLQLNSSRRNSIYTIEDMISVYTEIMQDMAKIHYKNAPIDRWILEYRPLIYKMVEDVYPAYKKCYPDKQDVLSILYETIVKLYSRGYYLHKFLILKAFKNNLNMSIRKSKYFVDETDSFDAPLNDDNSLTLKDVVPDPESMEENIAEKEYWEDLFNVIKNEMLKEMSELSFDRILLQLDTKTIDNYTAKTLKKMRERFNPGYIKRPNAYGKSKSKKNEGGR